MKKKKLLLILVVCIVGMIAYFIGSSPKGDTIESREALLNKAIVKGSSWTIVKETKIEDLLICCAYSTDGKSTIAVFEPTSNGKYMFSTSTNRDSDDIIISGAVINGEWYDLFWFNGAQTEYAEIVYTVNGVRKAPLKYDTTNMDLICIKNPEKSYSIDINYYDGAGNKYE